MEPYINAFVLAAQELASNLRCRNSLAMQEEICASYGIFLDEITDNEFNFLAQLVNDYA